MKIYSESYRQLSIIVAFVMGFVFFAFLQAVTRSYMFPLVLFGPTIYLVYRAMMNQTYKRIKTLKTPFPDQWRHILLEKVAFYQQLTREKRQEFEDYIQIFLAEQRIVGIDPVEIDDEIRLMVAAGAVTLAFYRPDWEFRNFRDILIYQDAFDPESYEISEDKDILGMVGTQIPIILSLKHLKEGFRHAGDGFNIAYHEFAHIIDLHDVGTHNNPLHGIFAHTLVQGEMKKIEKGQSVLRDYAALNESEFFAVATEFFYERPAIMSSHHPELYDNLVTLYNFDPLLKREPDRGRSKGDD